MKNQNKIASNRNFGIVFSIVFLIIATYPYLNGNEIKFWSLFISLIFLILGVLNAKILKPFNLIWHKIGVIIGSIFSPIVMAIIYFLVVTPIGYLAKLSGKNICNLKKMNTRSYWLKNNNQKSTMKDQF